MVKICNTPYPTDTPYHSLFKQYPFELSDFQKYAIQAIQENKHVLITAHTASGKTLPAEHAITHFIKKGKRVIYTTPLKALTNQKTNDFRKKYKNITFGTITGDIKSNPEADCLLMTTEILRNTLFQQQMIEKNTLPQNKMTLHFEMNIHNELAAVVFDEVHYINDAFRGSVVEETIMMLPKHIILIMLSATIDPAERFAKWIEKVKEREVWWMPTPKRIVPLIHYSYLTLRNALSDRHRQQNPLLDNKLHKPLLLRHAHDSFQDKNYHDIARIAHYFKKNNIFVNRKFVLNTITHYLHEHNLLPAICFVLSRKKCGEFAHSIEHSLNDGKTMSIIKQKCKQLLIKKLPNYQEYVSLVEYDNMVNLLMKGIAVHHSGIHPIFREMVELMFGEGYVQLLFATETFSAGINVPAKTVVFTGLQKFDGKSFRYLLPHEYTQMAGRGGRRGIDTKGTIIHLNNLFQMPPIQEYRTMLCGSPQKLDSKFKISFDIILQLISTQQPFKPFIYQSMLKTSIDNEIKQIKDTIQDIKKKIIQKTELLRYCKTPLVALNTYFELEEEMNVSSRKICKRITKDKRKLENKHKHIIIEIQKKREIAKLKYELEKENMQLGITEGYVSKTIEIIIDVLIDYSFVQKSEEEYPYLLSEKGTIATNIQEVNALVFADLLHDRRLDMFSSRELSAIFSCFANISIPREQRIQISALSLDARMKQILHTIQDYYNEMQDIEMRYQIDTTDEYEISYELIPLILDWCETSNDMECKMIFQKAKTVGISIGEFTKAILKINNITKEFEKVCIIQNNMTLLEKIKKIPELTLKSIATNQSLYL